MVEQRLVGKKNKRKKIEKHFKDCNQNRFTIFSKLGVPVDVAWHIQRNIEKIIKLWSALGSTTKYKDNTATKNIFLIYLSNIKSIQKYIEGSQKFLGDLGSTSYKRDSDIKQFQPHFKM